MSMFDFDDDPTKSAEDQMSDAFGCIMLTIIAAVACVAAALVGLIFLVKAIF